MNAKWPGIVAIVAVLATPVLSTTIINQKSPGIAQETFPDQAAVDNWTLVGDGATTHDSGFAGESVSGDPGVLLIEHTTGVQPSDAMVGTTDSAFVGNFVTKNVQGVWFDFYVDSGSPVPDALELYFVGDGNTWYWDLSSQLTTGWGVYGANIPGTGTGGADMFGTWFHPTADWDLALANVSEIGISIFYPMESTMLYAIDNFTLQDEPYLVPEPETYAFIAMALLSLAFVYRKRLEEQFQAAMAHVQTMRMG